MMEYRAILEVMHEADQGLSFAETKARLPDQALRRWLGDAFRNHVGGEDC